MVTVTEAARLRGAIREIEQYARTSYAECAMIDRRGDSRLMEIVNMARKALTEKPTGENDD